MREIVDPVNPLNQRKDAGSIFPKIYRGRLDASRVRSQSSSRSSVRSLGRNESQKSFSSMRRDRSLPALPRASLNQSPSYSSLHRNHEPSTVKAPRRIVLMDQLQKEERAQSRTMESKNTRSRVQLPKIMRGSQNQSQV